MDELEGIVQRMIDAGESEENIAAVIREFNAATPPAPVKAQAGMFDASQPMTGREFLDRNRRSDFGAAEAAAEHPFITAGVMMAAGGPAAARGAVSAVKATPGVVARALSNPVVSGGIGAVEGYRQGGISGALAGGALGAAGSTHLGNLAKRLGIRVAPKPTPVPGARIVKGAPAQSFDDMLAAELQAGMKAAPTATRVQPSAPAGGGYTTPPDVPIPQDAKSVRRIAPFAKNARARYRELSGKTILSPDEANELKYLESIVTRQAEQAGRSYAAGGK